MLTLLSYRRNSLCFALFFALLLFCLFFSVLFSSNQLVLSIKGTDLNAFAPWRAFGFGSLRQGDLPLWNPHLFSGTPFVANFQTGMFYPVNWVHLIFATPTAINIEIICNLLLGALGMFFWTRHQQLSTLSCWFAPLVWILGAPFFLKISAGQLAPLAAMCWIPWLLWSVDLVRDEERHRGYKVATVALAMQFVSGHPQTAYNTGIALFLYCFFRFIAERVSAQRPTRKECRTWLVLTGILLCSYAVAATIAAIQLWPGLALSQESSRSGGVPLQFAQMFSLPPEHLLTLLAPSLFGYPVEKSASLYWGRGYLWEMSLFMGIGTLALAMHGILIKPRTTLPLWATFLVLMVMALGHHTPLFQWLYDYLPAFNKFRGHSKFIVPASACLSLLAAYGLHDLMTTRQRLKVVGSGLGILAFTCVATALWLFTRDSSWWQAKFTWYLTLGENYSLPYVVSMPDFINTAGVQIAQSMLNAGITCFSLCIFWFWCQKERRASYVIAGISVIEVLVFACLNRPSFPYQTLASPDLQDFAQTHINVDRILSSPYDNMTMMVGMSDIWGYDPVVLGRYLEFMVWSQNANPEIVNVVDVHFNSYNRLYRMLRCRYIRMSTPKGVKNGEVNDPLPPLLLMQDYRVLQRRDEIFAAMGKTDFEPERTVILEEEPDPKPAPYQQGSAAGTARILHTSPDSLLIEATLRRPALLLLTEAFSKGWTIVSDDAGKENKPLQNYKVLPANYVLRVVPLTSGTHRFWMRYEPRAFSQGRAVSLLGLFVFGVTAWLLPKVMWRRNVVQNTEPKIYAK